ncbi:MAG: hypothetical protein KBS62_07180, partial [Oscillospiraceae bacterium]|nr:hypothetical protein [Candidatus Ruminococcus equi]
MKKLRQATSVVLVIMMVISMFSITMFTSSAALDDNTYVLGDADRNEDVAVYDATFIQKSIARASGYEIDKATDLARFLSADVDKDDDIAIYDATWIQKYIARYQEAIAMGIGQTYTIQEPTTEPTTEPVPTGITVYLNVNGSDWPLSEGQSFFAHSWDGVTPATTSLMTQVDDGIYSFEIPEGNIGMLFGRLTSGEYPDEEWTNVDKQTDSLTVPVDENNMYYVSSQTWGPYAPIPTTTEETETSTPGELTDGFYLVGLLNGVEHWTEDTLTPDMKLAANEYAPGEYMLDWTFYDGDGIKVAK